MHHYIFPTKDTFITNRLNLDRKNFGIDEILQIGTTNTSIRSWSPTKDYLYVNNIFIHQAVEFFNGIFTGSLNGIVSFISGSIIGNDLIFSSSYFSGSIDGISVEESGYISGSSITGSIIGYFTSSYSIGLFVGQLTGSTTCLNGTGSGIDSKQHQTATITTIKYIDRSLLEFDLLQISKSIVEDNIIDPHFFLNAKVCNEYNLPITYTIYALPISQSWNMGDGYFCNGGSNDGVNWWYMDNNDGTSWYTSSLITPRPPIDFIHNPSLTSASFGFGGGTWYNSPHCSQSFNYQSSDIKMDITPIVLAWLNKSIPNQGIILLHSDELQSTGSGFILKFFSRDTNTIYSPYLDLAWDDSIFQTGSISTGSIQISQIKAGISASIQSGSIFSIGGGISGSFSGSTYLTFTSNYITASEQIFNYSVPNEVSNNTWYVNNGYHYDSWQTSWQLDPFHGGFLPNTDIKLVIVPDFGSSPISQFTGSFTGSFSGTASIDGVITGSSIGFYTDYFSGSIDDISHEIISGSISGSLIDGNIIGTISSTYQSWLFIGSLTSSIIFLNGTGSGNYLDTTYLSFDGFTDGIGLRGNIINLPVFGSVKGFISISQSYVIGPCGSSFSASLAKAMFMDGPYSGSTFTAYYIDSMFENGQLTGSWIPLTLMSSTISIPIPSGMYPHTYAYVNGPYINGKALGVYNVFSSTSASFSGQFIGGNLIGGYIYSQLSGSINTSDVSYTSSVIMTSNNLSLLDINRPFTINLQNLQPEYKAGDMVKINIFGRKKFPLKYFGKSTQQEQYLIPEILPSASYYALRDNQTNEIIIDFDSYTQISCEYPSGNYFFIDTTGFAQERYYGILIRIRDGNTTYTIDTGKPFKIIR